MCLGSVQQLLWAAEPCKEEQEHRLRFMWGTPLPIDHDAFEKRFKLKLAKGGGYGSTDAGSVALPLWDKTGYGKILDRYEVCIVDEHDDPVAVGEAGEMLIRPKEPFLMSAYYLGMPDVTLESWRNLWFHSGDLCRLDADGDLFWIARMSERIRVNGEMVSGFEIEEVIWSHPDIEDCAAIGTSDGRGEEIITIIATLKDGSSLDLKGLQAFCQNKMSRFMLPSRLEILSEMPRTPTGKVAKGELRKLFS